MTDDDGNARVDPPEEEPAAEVSEREPPATGMSERGRPAARSSAGEQPTAETSEDEPPTVTVELDGVRPDGADEPGTMADPESGAPDASDGIDRRGWLLVAVVVVSFVVIPGIVLLRPLRVVGFRTTYLLLPLLPAIVLGATAVWVAVRSRQGER